MIYNDVQDMSDAELMIVTSYIYNIYKKTGPYICRNMLRSGSSGIAIFCNTYSL